jgi:hypothetical protein
MPLHREGPTPIPIHGERAVTFVRHELVALVREVLGDVEQVRVARTYGLTLYRGVKALRAEFVCGSDIIGTYLIPLPHGVAELVDDEERNPYNALRCNLSVATDLVVDRPGPVVATTPGSEAEGA